MYQTAMRITSLLTALIFAWVNTSWAEPVLPQAPAESPSLSFSQPVLIPEELGAIQSEYRSAEGSPFVVFIQDAHAILDAQHHIQKLIDYFKNQYGVDLVALEGGQGALDATLFRTFPDERVKEKVLTQYLERGELSGAEMAAIFNSKEASYYGIEDWNLYEENYLAYLRAMQVKEKILEKLKALKTQFDEERGKIYSPKLNEFHKHVEAFYEESSHLLELLKYLLEVTRDYERLPVTSRNLIGGRYPHLALLFESLERDSSMEKETLEVQIRRLGEDFKKKFFGKLPLKKQKEFNRSSQAFLTGAIDAGSFLKVLVETAHTLGVKPKLSPTLQALLGHVETLSTIKGTKLFDELRSFLGDVETNLIAKPEEKKLAERYKKLRLLKDLANLELTREQWEEISTLTLPSPFQGEGGELLAPAREFYRLALKRDQAFHRNLEELLRKEKARSAIVLAGGFHAQGFEESLKDAGYSYAVISPKINSLEGKEVYSEIMQGKLSYKPYLKTTFYDAFVRHSSINLVDELNEPDFKKNLKLWRDEVIRKLANDGRITEASRYTRYIDLLFKVYFDKWGRSPSGTVPNKEQILKAIEQELNAFRDDTVNHLWQRFQLQLKEFTHGLQELIQNKSLTRENVSSLLDEVGKSNLSAPRLNLMPQGPRISKTPPPHRFNVFTPYLDLPLPEKSLEAVGPAVAGIEPGPLAVPFSVINQVQAPDALDALEVKVVSDLRNKFKNGELTLTPEGGLEAQGKILNWLRTRYADFTDQKLLQLMKRAVLESEAKSPVESIPQGKATLGTMQVEYGTIKTEQDVSEAIRAPQPDSSSIPARAESVQQTQDSALSDAKGGVERAEVRKEEVNRVAQIAERKNQREKNLSLLGGRGVNGHGDAGPTGRAQVGSTLPQSLQSPLPFQSPPVLSGAKSTPPTVNSKPATITATFNANGSLKNASLTSPAEMNTTDRLSAHPESAPRRPSVKNPPLSTDGTIAQKLPRVNPELQKSFHSTGKSKSGVGISQGIILEKSNSGMIAERAKVRKETSELGRGLGEILRGTFDRQQVERDLQRWISSNASLFLAPEVPLINLLKPLPRFDLTDDPLAKYFKKRLFGRDPQPALSQLDNDSLWRSIQANPKFRKFLGDQTLEKFRKVMKNKLIRAFFGPESLYSNGLRQTILLRALRLSQGPTLSLESIVSAIQAEAETLHHLEQKEGMLFNSLGVEVEVTAENAGADFDAQTGSVIFYFLLGGKLGFDEKVEYALEPAYSAAVVVRNLELMEELGLIPKGKPHNMHINTIIPETFKGISLIQNFARWTAFTGALAYTHRQRIEIFTSGPWHWKPIDNKTDEIQHIEGTKPKKPQDTAAEKEMKKIRLEYRLTDSLNKDASRYFHFLHGLMAQAAITAYKLSRDSKASFNRLEYEMAKNFDQFIQAMEALKTEMGPEASVLDLDWFGPSQPDMGKMLNALKNQPELMARILELIQNTLLANQELIEKAEALIQEEISADEISSIGAIKQLVDEMNQLWLLEPTKKTETEEGLRHFMQYFNPQRERYSLPPDYERYRVDSERYHYDFDFDPFRFFIPKINQPTFEAPKYEIPKLEMVQFDFKELRHIIFAGYLSWWQQALRWIAGWLPFGLGAALDRWLSRKVEAQIIQRGEQQLQNLKQLVSEWTEGRKVSRESGVQWLKLKQQEGRFEDIPYEARRAFESVLQYQTILENFFNLKGNRDANRLLPLRKNLSPEDLNEALRSFKDIALAFENYEKVDFEGVNLNFSNRASSLLNRANAYIRKIEAELSPRAEVRMKMEKGGERITRQNGPEVLKVGRWIKSPDGRIGSIARISPAFSARNPDEDIWIKFLKENGFTEEVKLKASTVLIEPERDPSKAFYLAKDSEITDYKNRNRAAVDQYYEMKETKEKRLLDLEQQAEPLFRKRAPYNSPYMFQGRMFRPDYTKFLAGMEERQKAAEGQEESFFHLGNASAVERKILYELLGAPLMNGPVKSEVSIRLLFKKRQNELEAKLHEILDERGVLRQEVIQAVKQKMIHSDSNAFLKAWLQFVDPATKRQTTLKDVEKWIENEIPFVERILEYEIRDLKFKNPVKIVPRPLKTATSRAEVRMEFSPEQRKFLWETSHTVRAVVLTLEAGESLTHLDRKTLQNALKRLEIEQTHQQGRLEDMEAGERRETEGLLQTLQDLISELEQQIPRSQQKPSTVILPPSEPTPLVLMGKYDLTIHIDKGKILIRALHLPTKEIVNFESGIDSSITIGRNTDNNLLLTDPTISRFHALIERNPEGALVMKDLGSTNGFLARGKLYQASLEAKGEDTLVLFTREEVETASRAEVRSDSKSRDSHEDNLTELRRSVKAKETNLRKELGKSHPDYNRALVRLRRLYELGKILANNYSDPRLFEFYFKQVAVPLLSYTAFDLNRILGSRMGLGLMRAHDLSRMRIPGFILEEAIKSIVKNDKPKWEQARDFFYLKGLSIIVDPAGIPQESRQTLEKAADLILKIGWLKEHKFPAQVESIYLINDPTSPLGGKHLSLERTHVMINVGDFSPLEIALALVEEDSHAEDEESVRLANIRNFEGQLETQLKKSIATLFHPWLMRRSSPFSLLVELKGHGAAFELFIRALEMGVIEGAEAEEQIKLHKEVLSDAELALRILQGSSKLGRLNDEGKQWLSELQTVWDRLEDNFKNVLNAHARAEVRSMKQEEQRYQPLIQTLKRELQAPPLSSYAEIEPVQTTTDVLFVSATFRGIVKENERENTDYIKIGRLAPREALILDKLHSDPRFRKSANHLPLFKGFGELDSQDYSYVSHTRGVHEGDPYLVTQKVEGENLQSIIDRLRDGTISETQAFHYLLPLVEALVDFHSEGVAHGELAPDEVYIKDGKAILLDFALALIKDDPNFDFDNLDRLRLTEIGGSYAGWSKDWFARDVNTLLKIILKLLLAVSDQKGKKEKGGSLLWSVFEQMDFDPIKAQKRNLSSEQLLGILKTAEKMMGTHEHSALPVTPDVKTSRAEVRSESEYVINKVNIYRSRTNLSRNIFFEFQDSTGQLWEGFLASEVDDKDPPILIIEQLGEKPKTTGYGFHDKEDLNFVLPILEVLIKQNVILNEFRKYPGIWRPYLQAFPQELREKIQKTEVKKPDPAQKRSLLKRTAAYVWQNLSEAEKPAWDRGIDEDRVKELMEEAAGGQFSLTKKDRQWILHQLEIRSLNELKKISESLQIKELELLQIRSIMVPYMGDKDFYRTILLKAVLENGAVTNLGITSSGLLVFIAGTASHVEKPNSRTFRRLVRFLSEDSAINARVLEEMELNAAMWKDFVDSSVFPPLWKAAIRKGLSPRSEARTIQEKLKEALSRVKVMGKAGEAEIVFLPRGLHDLDFELRLAGKSIGVTSLDFALREEQPVVEIGRTIFGRFQQQGYGTALVIKVLEALPPDVMMIQTIENEDTLKALNKSLPEAYQKEIRGPKDGENAQPYWLALNAEMAKIYQNHPELLPGPNDPILIHSQIGTHARSSRYQVRLMVNPNNGLLELQTTRRAEVRSLPEGEPFTEEIAKAWTHKVMEYVDIRNNNLLMEHLKKREPIYLGYLGMKGVKQPVEIYDEFRQYFYQLLLEGKRQKIETSYRPQNLRDTPEAYLNKVIQNSLIDFLRKKASAERIFVQLDEEKIDLSNFSGKMDTLRELLVAENERELSRYYQKTLDALARLEPEQKELFADHYILGKTFEGIAQERQISLSAVKRIIYGARNKIREDLKVDFEKVAELLGRRAEVRMKFSLYAEFQKQLNTKGPIRWRAGKLFGQVEADLVVRPFSGTPGLLDIFIVPTEKWKKEITDRWKKENIPLNLSELFQAIDSAENYVGEDTNKFPGAVGAIAAKFEDLSISEKGDSLPLLEVLEIQSAKSLLDMAKKVNKEAPPGYKRSGDKLLSWPSSSVNRVREIGEALGTVVWAPTPEKINEIYAEKIKGPALARNYRIPFEIQSREGKPLWRKMVFLPPSERALALDPAAISKQQIDPSHLVWVSSESVAQVEQILGQKGFPPLWYEVSRAEVRAVKGRQSLGEAKNILLTRGLTNRRYGEAAEELRVAVGSSDGGRVDEAFKILEEVLKEVAKELGAFNSVRNALIDIADKENEEKGRRVVAILRKTLKAAGGSPFAVKSLQSALRMIVRTRPELFEGYDQKYGLSDKDFEGLKYLFNEIFKETIPADRETLLKSLSASEKWEGISLKERQLAANLFAKLQSGHSARSEVREDQKLETPEWRLKEEEPISGPYGGVVGSGGQESAKGHKRQEEPPDPYSRPKSYPSLTPSFLGFREPNERSTKEIQSQSYQKNRDTESPAKERANDQTPKNDSGGIRYQADGILSAPGREPKHGLKNREIVQESQEEISYYENPSFPARTEVREGISSKMAAILDSKIRERMRSVGAEGILSARDAVARGKEISRSADYGIVGDNDFISGVEIWKIGGKVDHDELEGALYKRDAYSMLAVIPEVEWKEGRYEESEERLGNTIIVLQHFDDLFGLTNEPGYEKVKSIGFGSKGKFEPEVRRNRPVTPNQIDAYFVPESLLSIAREELKGQEHKIVPVKGYEDLEIMATKLKAPKFMEAIYEYLSSHGDGAYWMHAVRFPTAIDLREKTVRAEVRSNQPIDVSTLQLLKTSPTVDLLDALKAVGIEPSYERQQEIRKGNFGDLRDEQVQHLIAILKIKDEELSKAASQLSELQEETSPSFPGANDPHRIEIDRLKAGILDLLTKNNQLENVRAIEKQGYVFPLVAVVLLSDDTFWLTRDYAILATMKRFPPINTKGTTNQDGYKNALRDVLLFADKSDQFVDLLARLRAFGEYPDIQNSAVGLPLPDRLLPGTIVLDVAAGLNAGHRMKGLDPKIKYRPVDKSRFVTRYLQEVVALLNLTNVSVMQEDVLQMEKPQELVGAIVVKNVWTYVPNFSKRLDKMIQWIEPGGQLVFQSDPVEKQRSKIVENLGNLAQKLITEGWIFDFDLGVDTGIGATSTYDTVRFFKPGIDVEQKVISKRWQDYVLQSSGRRAEVRSEEIDSPQGDFASLVGLGSEEERENFVREGRGLPPGEVNAFLKRFEREAKGRMSAVLGEVTQAFARTEAQILRNLSGLLNKLEPPAFADTAPRVVRQLILKEVFRERRLDPWMEERLTELEGRISIQGFGLPEEFFAPTPSFTSVDEDVADRIREAILAIDRPMVIEDQFSEGDIKQMGESLARAIIKGALEAALTLSAANRHLMFRIEIPRSFRSKLERPAVTKGDASRILEEGEGLLVLNREAFISGSGASAQLTVTTQPLNVRGKVLDAAQFAEGGVIYREGPAGGQVLTAALWALLEKQLGEARLNVRRGPAGNETYVIPNGDFLTHLTVLVLAKLEEVRHAAMVKTAA